MKMNSTTIFKPGHIIVVNVPFSNHSGVKRRPALVVSVAAFHRKLPDVIVCPVSSQPLFYRNPRKGDIPLRHWRHSGLLHPSAVRISKVLSVDRQIIQGILGSLSRQDAARVNEGLREALGL